MVFNMKLRCKFGFHKYEDSEKSITKNMCFGLAGCELPGIRIKQVCECGAYRYLSLNLMMPDKYLYNENIWYKK